MNKDLETPNRLYKGFNYNVFGTVGIAYQYRIQAIDSKTVPVVSGETFNTVVAANQAAIKAIDLLVSTIKAEPVSADEAKSARRGRPKKEVGS